MGVHSQHYKATGIDGVNSSAKKKPLETIVIDLAMIDAVTAGVGM